MRINHSTASFYDRSATAMASLTTRAQTLQTQIATGRKLLAPSDDAAGYRRLQGMAIATADDTAYAGNIALAQGIAAQADTTLSSINTLLQQASEWSVQAASGSLSPEAKQALATQLRGTIDGLVDLANGRDARGLPLLGGAGEDAAVTRAADGSLVFAAGTPPAIPIGDGQSVVPGASARAVLRLPSGRDVAQVLTDMADALDAGATPTPALGDELAALGTQATLAQSSLGARAARLDLQAAYLQQAATDRETARSAIEDVDVTQAITELQKTSTILSATQASFSKLSGLSLFDYLR